ncbi:MAG TPA: hypothetical protein VEL47_01265 [Myxococcota bacterium]|nr:hypothetical protein [Myxococcota bacterium]
MDNWRGTTVDEILIGELGANVLEYNKECREVIQKHCKGPDPRLEFLCARRENLNRCKIVSGLIFAGAGCYALTTEWFGFSAPLSRSSPLYVFLLNSWKEIHETLCEFDDEAKSGMGYVRRELEFFSRLDHHCGLYTANRRLEEFNTELAKDISQKTALGTILEKIHQQTNQDSRLKNLSLVGIFSALLKTVVSNRYDDIQEEYPVCSFCGYEEYSRCVSFRILADKTITTIHNIMEAGIR